MNWESCIERGRGLKLMIRWLVDGFVGIFVLGGRGWGGGTVGDVDGMSRIRVGYAYLDSL